MLLSNYDSIPRYFQSNLHSAINRKSSETLQPSSAVFNMIYHHFHLIISPPLELKTQDSLGFSSVSPTILSLTIFCQVSICLHNRLFNQRANCMFWVLRHKRKQFVLHRQNSIINQFLKLSLRWFLGFLRSGKIKHF